MKDIVALYFTIGFVLILVPIIFGVTSGIYWGLIASLLLGWGVGDGYEQSSVFTHKGQVTKHLVSAAPSHTQINGSVGGNFLFFSGIIQENRVYLLREEVEEGLYKDFEVKKEVYIREDSSLTDRGKFVQYFNCKDITRSYEYAIWELYRETNNECSYQKQEIIVPKGSVIKELNI